MKDQKLVILIILLIKRKMLKLYKNTFKTIASFFFSFSFISLSYLVYLEERPRFRLNIIINYFLFSKMTPQKGAAVNDLSIQVKNVICLPLKTHEQLSRTHLDMFVIQDVKKC